jgi:hypothetical protein
MTCFVAVNPAGEHYAQVAGWHSVERDLFETGSLHESPPDLWKRQTVKLTLPINARTALGAILRFRRLAQR